jgi:hypothetical protein
MPRQDANLAKQREAVDAFLAASRAGDFEALLAVLDPDVVFRASGSRELQQELNGATEVARSVAAFGPRLATLCHRATVNGRPGLLIKTRQGPLGAVGFTVSGALITTVDLTVDPEKLGSSDRPEDAGLSDSPDGNGAAGEPSLLGYLRGRQGSAADRIISEALSWPGVDRAPGRFGSVVLRVGRRELGHLHGDAVADVPLAAARRGQLVEDGAAPDRQPQDDSAWVTIPLETEDGVQQALALLRGNYERMRAERRLKGPV